MASVHHPAAPMPPPARPELCLPPGMRRAAFCAMGTTVTVLVPVLYDEAGRQVEGLFSEWEEIFSRFRAQSELSRVNRQAGQSVTVSPLFAEVLTLALAAAESTGGLFDPTLLVQLSQLGYDRSFERLPRHIAAPPGPIVCGGAWSAVQCDRMACQVTVPTGVALDFGGLVKGLAVDRALQLLQGAGVEAALVDAGGDLGVYGRPPHDTAWPLSVAGRTHERIVSLHQGCMATSGRAHRHWQQDGVARHHLLDPRTGLPACSDVWSVTAVAERCVQAEVAAKVAFILGPEEGRGFLEAHHIAGLILREDGGAVATSCWPCTTEEAS